MHLRNRQLLVAAAAAVFMLMAMDGKCTVASCTWLLESQCDECHCTENL